MRVPFAQHATVRPYPRMRPEGQLSANAISLVGTRPPMCPSPRPSVRTKYCWVGIITRSPEGAFPSAFSCGSIGKAPETDLLMSDGRYFTWVQTRLRAALGLSSPFCACKRLLPGIGHVQTATRKCSSPSGVRLGSRCRNAPTRVTAFRAHVRRAGLRAASRGIGHSEDSPVCRPDPASDAGSTGVSFW